MFSRERQMNNDRVLALDKFWKFQTTHIPPPPNRKMIKTFDSGEKKVVKTVPAALKISNLNKWPQTGEKKK